MPMITAHLSLIGASSEEVLLPCAAGLTGEDEFDRAASKASDIGAGCGEPGLSTLLIFSVMSGLELKIRFMPYKMPVSSRAIWLAWPLDRMAMAWAIF